MDVSDQEATHAWAGLSFVDTVGRLNYTGNPQPLATRLYEAFSLDDEPLIHSLTMSGLSCVPPVHWRSLTPIVHGVLLQNTPILCRSQY